MANPRIRRTIELPDLPSFTAGLVLFYVAGLFLLPIVLGGPPLFTRQYLGLWALLFSVCLGIPGAFLGGIWLARRHIQRHVPLEDVCREFSLDEAAARRFAAQQHIEPRYNIGGKPLYRVEDFRPALSLLRPYKGPAQLLRAAESASTPDEVLVRPARE